MLGTINLRVLLVSLKLSDHRLPVPNTHHSTCTLSPSPPQPSYWPLDRPPRAPCPAQAHEQRLVDADSRGQDERWPGAGRGPLEEPWAVLRGRDSEAAEGAGDARSLSPGLVLCPPVPEGLVGPFWRQKCPRTEPKHGHPKGHSTFFETGSFERSPHVTK